MADDYNVQQLTRAIDELNARMGAHGKMLFDTARRNERADTQRRTQDATEWQKMSERVNKGWDNVLVGINKSATGAAGAIKTLTKETTSAAGAFVGLSKALLGGAIGGILIGSMTDYTTGLYKTFQELTDHGKTFSGDVFDMAQAAANAGLSLSDYAKLNKQNSVVASRLAGNNQGGLAGLAKQVRESTYQFGMLGYSTDDLNQLVGAYAETMRLQGRLDEMSSRQGRESMVKMTTEATALAQALGTSRKQTIENALSAMKDEAYATRLSLMTEADRKKYGDAFNSAITGFAAQAGESGQMLSKMLAQTAAYDGRAYNTDASRQLFSKILPQGATLMEEAYSKIKADGENASYYQNQYVVSLKKVIEGQRENLKYHVEAGGEYGEQARRILKMYSELEGVKEIDKKTAKLQQEYSSSLTAVLGSMDDALNQVKTGILSTIMPALSEPMRAFAEGITKFIKSTDYDDFSKKMKSAAETIGKWMKEMFKTENMALFSSYITSASKSVADFIASITTQNLKDALDVVKGGLQFVGGILQGFGTVLGGVLTLLSPLKNHLKELGIALGVVIGGAYLFKKVMDFKNMFSTLKEMNVAAAVVNVNGKNLGGGPDLGGGNGNRRGGPNGPHNPRGGLSGRGKFALAIGGIAAVATAAWGASSILDRFKSSTAAAAGASQAAADAMTTETLAEPLDDLRRQMLDFKIMTGEATEDEKKEVEADKELRRKRREQASRARPANGDANTPQPATPRDQTPETPGPATPTDPETTGSIASSLTSAIAEIGPGLASSILPGLSGISTTLGGFMTKVSGEGGLLAKIGGQSGILSKIGPTVASGVSMAVSTLGPTIVSAINPTMAGAFEMIGQTIQRFGGSGGILMGLAQTITSGVSGTLAKVAPAVAAAAGPVTSGILGKFGDLMAKIGGAGGILAKIGGAGGVLAKIGGQGGILTRLGGEGGILSKVGTKISSGITTAISTVSPTVAAAIGPAATNILSATGDLMAKVSGNGGFFAKVGAMIGPELSGSVTTALSKAVPALTSVVAPAATTLMSKAGEIASKITGADGLISKIAGDKGVLAKAAPIGEEVATTVASAISKTAPEAAAATAAASKGVFGKVGDMMTKIGGEGGFLSKMAPYAKTFAKNIPIIGAVASAGFGAYDAYGLKQQRDRGEISEEEYKKGLTKVAVNSGIDAAAALVPGWGRLAATAINMGNQLSDLSGIGSIGDVAASFVGGSNSATRSATTAVSVGGPRDPQQINMEERLEEMKQRLEQTQNQLTRTTEDKVVIELIELRKKTEEMLAQLIYRLEELNTTTARSGALVGRSITSSSS